MTRTERIDLLIERSSLGEPGAKLVRSQTPQHIADEIVTLALERARISTESPTYQPPANTTRPGAPGPQPQESNAMAKKLTSGTAAPRSGQYQERGPRGRSGREVTAVRGEPLPPTTKPGSSYVLVDPTNNKSGKR